MTATNGLSLSETSLADITVEVGRWGKSVRSSRSGNPALTNVGRGTNERIATTKSEVSNPLATRSVLKNDVHAWRVRGGSERIATRKMIVRRHKAGSSTISGHIENFAHHGTIGGNCASGRAACSGMSRVSETSRELITIFSMKSSEGGKGSLFCGILVGFAS